MGCSCLRSRRRYAGRDATLPDDWDGIHFLFSNSPILEPVSKAFPLHAVAPHLAPHAATQPTAITQQDGDILIRHEWMDVSRLIDLPPYATTTLAPAVLGHSRGDWQGDTLVITTTGFTPGVLTQ